ncbi:MAG: hypothetical protein QM820_42985 [Minicystis sp.]
MRTPRTTPSSEIEIRHAHAHAQGHAGRLRDLPAEAGDHVVVRHRQAAAGAARDFGVGQGDGRPPVLQHHREAVDRHAARALERIEEPELGQHRHARRVHQLAAEARIHPRARLQHEDAAPPVREGAGRAEAGETTTDDHHVCSVHFVSLYAE